MPDLVLELMGSILSRFGRKQAVSSICRCRGTRKRRRARPKAPSGSAKRRWLRELTAIKARGTYAPSNAATFVRTPPHGCDMEPVMTCDRECGG